MTNIVECPVCKIKYLHDFPTHLRSNAPTINFCKTCKLEDSKKRIENLNQSDHVHTISKKQFDILKKISP